MSIKIETRTEFPESDTSEEVSYDAKEFGLKSISLFSYETPNGETLPFLQVQHRGIDSPEPHHKTRWPINFGTFRRRRYAQLRQEEIALITNQVFIKSFKRSTMDENYPFTEVAYFEISSAVNTTDLVIEELKKTCSISGFSIRTLRRALNEVYKDYPKLA